MMLTSIRDVVPQVRMAMTAQATSGSNSIVYIGVASTVVQNKRCTGGAA